MAGRLIQPANRPLDSSIEAPPSKSVTHRALVTAALAAGDSRIDNPLDADDTRVTRAGLEQLGIEVSDVTGGWTVHGLGGRIPGGGRLDLADSGTSLRLLLALAALGERPSGLDGSPRLRERPVQELAVALERLGASVSLSDTPGGIPARAGGRAPRGGSVDVRSDRSSQFASALLSIGCRLPGGLDLRMSSPAVSLPYVELTAAVLRDFGGGVERPETLHWRVRPGRLGPRSYRVEGDHSSASYFLAAPCFAGGRVLVRGLDPSSRQPDARLSDLLEAAGVEVSRTATGIETRTRGGRLRAFDVDLAEAPDLAPTMAALALVADGPCRLRGLAHLRIKESDRLAVLADNLRALGRQARATESALEIAAAGTARADPVVIRTASDHRIAMAFAVAGLAIAGIEIDDADCVSKSNPWFWDQLEALRG